MIGPQRTIRERRMRKIYIPDRNTIRTVFTCLINSAVDWIKLSYRVRIANKFPL